ncbi:MAG: phenylacetate--CoA ligase family protein [Pseudomonadota bacterium]
MTTTPQDLRYLSVLPQIAWPAPLAQSPSNRLSMLFQLEQSQWWSPEALQQAQFDQLRRLVPHAARHVPLYARTLRDFTAPESVTPQRWTDLPLLTRADLAPGGRALHSALVPREHGQVHPSKTSGSTGVAVEFQVTDLDNFFWKVFSLREHFWHRRDFSQKLMSIRYAKESVDAAARGLHSDAWGGATEGVVRTGAASLYHIEAKLGFLAERLMVERPGYLLSHASLLSGLIDHCERHSLEPQGLKEVRSIGETMADDLRERCRKVWGVPVVDVYTCQEAGYLASQCPEHEHYHVQSENVLLEVIDADGKPCRPGDIGRVVVTSLHNFATPLIRYEVGDCAEVGAPCPCGRGLPVLKRVMGRFRNLLTLPNGEQRWPKMGYEELRRVAPVDLMQMVQHGLNDIEVRLVLAQPLTSEQQAALTRFIQHNLGHAFTLRFSTVDTIRSTVNGKVEQFISMLGRTKP